MTATAPRHPGIAFETVAPSVGGALPRTDIAGFVGFAAAGPRHLPVPIESVTQFDDLFGADVVLGRSADTGAPVAGQLAPGVRGFFRAGGRRCWVVRVANARAEASRFALPGVLLASRIEEGSWVLGSAEAMARSPGSWADSVAVNLTALEQSARLLPPEPPAPSTDPPTLLGATPGDLVRLSYRVDGELIVGFVKALSPRPETLASPGGPRARAEIRPEQALWFHSLVAANLVTGSFPSFPSAVITTVPVTGAGQSVFVTGWDVRPDEGVLSLQLDGAPLEEVRPGTWVTLQGMGPGAPFLLVDEVVDRPTSIGFGSGWQIRSTRAWLPLSAAEAQIRTAGATPEVRVVTAELWAKDSRGVTRMAGLGLTDSHPRSLGRLSSDDVLLNTPEPETQSTRTAFEEDQLRPRRFPLACKTADPKVERIFLPLASSPFPRESWYQPARHSGALPHLRNGLAAMEGALFVDPELHTFHSPPDRLQSDAFQVLHPPQSSDRTFGLQGIHSLLSIEEVAILAVPDATAPSWTVEAGTGLPAIEAPTSLSIEPGATGASSGRLAWRQAGPVDAIKIEAATDARFLRSLGSWPFQVPTAADRWTPPGTVAWEPPPQITLSWSESDDQLHLELMTETLGSPSTQRRLEVEAAGWPVRVSNCAQRIFWRVSVEHGGTSSPWSATGYATLPRESFDPCPDDQLPAPSLTVSRAGGMITLTWSVPPGSPADSYTLETAPDPRFGGHRSIYRGPASTYSLWAADDRTWYFRVTASAGNRESPWSATISTGSVPIANQLLVRPAAAGRDSPLVAVHAALLVLAAARGDTVALLSLPLEFRDDEITEYRANLIIELSQTYRVGLGDGDRTLTYGAIYHPWPLVREPDAGNAARIAPVTPDGLIAGTIAARTLGGGPWLSPANRLLPGVVSLAWAAGPQEPADGLLPINRLEQRPDGFTTLSSWTLDRRSEVAELAVRRLLIVLRRLALREGAAFAFLPNDEFLARLVAREFESVLTDLFVRGALAGRTESEAFQVITDSRINTQRERDTGRLMVELRVAPSKPLAFLTIRLLQLGGEQLRTEEG